VPDISDADPVAVVHDWLRNHPDQTALLGGPEHVSALVEGPWPHVVVSDGPGGDLRDLVWSTEPMVTLEVVGHPDGYPGPAALRKLAIQQALLVAQLPEREVTSTQSVVSKVKPAGVLAWAPLFNGQQPRFVMDLLITIRPPLS
jgi:hypothetical protein